jgi:hypothetical protein
MATLTTDQYLDGGTARAAGEAFTMNGGVLTIRTDTRWHANAPASMTGVLGATSISSTLGGGVLIDARNVRWMAFDSGSGTVPAIGTTVTQGGVSGYLLGVWSALNAAPTAVGAAMPATGFLKFREVTGGTFAAGALSGITANTTEADRVGWIEVVQRQSVANTVPRLGFYRTRGDWFYLDNTSGAASQQIQIPTNGGGSGTRVPAVWIETGVGTNEYEAFPAMLITWFTTANLSTDARCKFVLMETGGTVRVGGNGTDSIGFLPPAGCRVRIPNILGRQSTSANGDANNIVPAASLSTRPDFTTTSAGEIDFEYFMNDWYHIFTSPYKVRIINCATLDIHSTSNNASPIELDNYVVGAYNGTSIALTVSNCPLGGTIENCQFYRAVATNNGHPLSLTGVSNLAFENISTGVIQYARATGNANFSQCRNITSTGVFRIDAVTLTAATCANLDFANVQYIDRLVGTTNSTTGKYAVTCTVSSDNIIVRSVDFGGYANVHPYLGLFNASNCSNLTFRNAGTPSAPIGGATNAPQYIYRDSGNNDGVRVQNCSLEATRTSLYLTVNTSKNQTFENLRGTIGSLQTLSVNTQVKGARSASNSVSGGASVYGSHWFDMFDSDTQGRLWLAFNEPTAFSADQYEAVVLGTGAGFTSAGQIVMPNLGDQIIFTMPYYAIGHTAFDNSAATLTGTNTGNFSYEYDLDTGSGFSGTYKTLNGANLSAESISPTTGFKLKFRITCTTANASNALTYVRVTTDSTLVAQQSALYPQDYATIALTGMVAGSRVQLYDTTNSAELFNAVVAGTSLTYATPYTADFNCRVRVMHQATVTAYEFVEFTESVTSAGVSRAITQTLDAVYNTNAINGGAVTGISINDGALLVEIDTGTLAWAQIYAYETYWLMTEEGIRDESRFMEAIDPANYLLTDFKIKNVSSPSEPLTITGGWGRDSVTGETVTLIDNTGGAIFSNPDLVIAYETSGGGGSGASAAEVWAYSTRTLTSGAAPSASTVAAAVRTELATELARVDVATSTRLADADYTTPDNASIAAILTDTGTTGVVLANNSITSSVVASNALNNSSFTTGYFNSINAEVDQALADYDAPTKAELDTVQASIEADIAALSIPTPADVAAIKAKTDALTFTVAGQVDTNIQYVNDVEVAGTGTELDPWNPA